MPRFTVQAAGRLVDELRQRFPDWKHKTIKERLKNGLVLVNNQEPGSAAGLLQLGDVVEVLARPRQPDSFFPAKLGEPPLPVLYADDSVVAIDKPSGLLSVASERERNETAVHIMRQWLAGLDRESTSDLHAAHRLDRDASGVLLLARSLQVKRKLAANWHKFQKFYVALVDGAPAEPEGVVDVPLWEDKGLFVREAHAGAGESALTRYRVMRGSANRSLLEVELGAGRKHQIRVHLAHLGCPIVGDLRYGVSKAKRLMLHARMLRILHPVDGRTVEIEAPIPPEFRRELKKR